MRGKESERKRERKMAGNYTSCIFICDSVKGGGGFSKRYVSRMGETQKDKRKQGRKSVGKFCLLKSCTPLHVAHKGIKQINTSLSRINRRSKLESSGVEWSGVRSGVFVTLATCVTATMSQDCRAPGH